MTIFSDNPHDRRMERLMMTVPNFAPRGVGFRFTEAQLFITTTAATPTEILTATMRQIRCPPFRKRFNEYIESEDKPMTYINEKHRARFTLAAKNVHRENYALLSALYLLTADQRLWSCCKHHIINGCVFFENIKLNCVLLGGVNDDEIGDFLNLTREHPWEVRFIELMPMGPCAAWPKERFLPVTEILNRFPALEEIEPNGVARRYRLPGAMGTVGLITPMSHEFCGACRRIRVTADGKLKGCLHSREEISLRGLHGRELEDAILRGILHKPRGHHLTEHASDTPRTMNEIGG